mmetsp:Transcript_28367/g.66034  ORF Transcript_28367/g.66034 Transcript_28367/m.66034 type:complete len:273 (+) Transcript_28367:37-855(+)
MHALRVQLLRGVGRGILRTLRGYAGVPLVVLRFHRAGVPRDEHDRHSQDDRSRLPPPMRSRLGRIQRHRTLLHLRPRWALSRNGARAASVQHRHAMSGVDREQVHLGGHRNRRNVYLQRVVCGAGVPAVRARDGLEGQREPRVRDLRGQYLLGLGRGELHGVPGGQGDRHVRLRLPRRLPVEVRLWVLLALRPPAVHQVPARDLQQWEGRHGVHTVPARSVHADPRVVVLLGLSCRAGDAGTGEQACVRVSRDRGQALQRYALYPGRAVSSR